MSGTTLALWALSLLALFSLLRWVIVAHHLLRARFRPPSYAPLQGMLSREMERFYAEPLAELIALGFELRGKVAVRPSAVMDDAPSYTTLVLYHPETHTSAELAPSENIQPARLHSIVFRNLLSNGRWLIGLNGEHWARLGELPRIELFDPYAPAHAEHWAAHQRRLEALAREGATAVPIEDHLGTLEAYGAEVMRELQEIGALEPSREKLLQIPFLRALGISLRILLEGKKLRRMLVARRALQGSGTSASMDDLPVELEIAAYRRAEALRRSGGRRGGGVLFALAVAGAVALAAMHILEPLTVLMLVGVVLLHELGHYAAMRAFGYEDTTIYLIPFFGGAATGTKARVALHEEMIVLLAGPVPGILLALFLRTVTPDFSGTAPGRELVLLLAAVNAINLLPLFPLDGGKIVDGLLARQRPFLLAILRGVAIVLFAGAAFAGRDYVLSVLAVATALTLPVAIRTSRLERAVIQNRAFDPVDPLRQVFERMRALELGAMSLASKIVIARQVLQRVDRTPQGAASTAMWCSAYAGGLVAGMIGFFAASIPPAGTDLPRRTLSHVVDCPRITADDSGLPESARRLLDDAIADAEDEPSFELACDARSTADAKSLEQELAIFGMVAAAYPLRPPWIEDPSLSAEALASQAAKRMTASKVVLARRRMGIEDLERDASFLMRLRWLFGQDTNKRLPADAYRRRIKALLAEDEKNPDFDRELAGWMLEMPRDPQIIERSAAMMGTLPYTRDEDGIRPLPPGRAVAVQSMVARASERTLAVEAAIFWEPKTALPLFIEHLCKRGCERVRWDVPRDPP